MRRAILIGAAVLAAAPAAAEARSARFVAFVQGTQVTTWQVPRHQFGVRDCMGATHLAESGSETVRFRTKPARLLVSQVGPGVSVKYGTWGRFAAGKPALTGTGKITRSYVDTLEYEPGPCGTRTPEPPSVRDCRTDAWDPEVRLRWEGDRVFVDADDYEVKFVECPLKTASGVSIEDVTEGVWERYPIDDVFDRAQGLVEVRAEKTFTEELRFGGSTTTTVSWRLRLRRARG